MKRGWLLAALLLSALLIASWFGSRWLRTSRSDDPPGVEAVNVKVQLDGARDRAILVRNVDETFSYVLSRYDGTTETLSPEAFAERLHRQQESRTLLSIIFNISHPVGIAWVSVGLLGQLLFTGRMLVQWLASEKSKRSVVPPAFWWLSVVGSLMLFAYFTWRFDIVGMLGQGFGLAIYLRNLHLIYFGSRTATRDVEPVPFN